MTGKNLMARHMEKTIDIMDLDRMEMLERYKTQTRRYRIESFKKGEMNLMSFARYRFLLPACKSVKAKFPGTSRRQLAQSRNEPGLLDTLKSTQGVQKLFTRHHAVHAKKK